MQRVIIYSDGSWIGINKAGIEVSGFVSSKILEDVSDMVNNEPDNATKKIEKIIIESNNKVNEVNKKMEKIEEKLSESIKETEEIVRPFRELLKLADDETILENYKCLELYEIDKRYVENDLFVYKDKVFRVLQNHISQIDWIPDETSALYKKISNVMAEKGNEIISYWKQPIGAHDLYSKGDKVIYNGQTWELVGTDTGHAPGVVVGIWEVI